MCSITRARACVCKPRIRDPPAINRAAGQARSCWTARVDGGRCIFPVQSEVNLGNAPAPLGPGTPASAAARKGDTAGRACGNLPLCALTRLTFSCHVEACTARRAGDDENAPGLSLPGAVLPRRGISLGRATSWTLFDTSELPASQIAANQYRLTAQVPRAEPSCTVPIRLLPHPAKSPTAPYLGSMLSKRALENAFIAVAIAILAANAALKLVARATISRAEVHEDESNHPLWKVERKDVLLEQDSWTRYQLDSAQQWAPLFPEGGVIHLGPEQTPYTVSMMHQLRCLDVVRDQLNRPKSERSEQPTRHCMNYLRQMLLCRGDLHLDPYQYPHKVRAVHPHAVRRCKDWRAVYEKVEENQREYAAFVGRLRNSTLLLS